MHNIEVVIGLLAGVALLGAIASRAGLPYPAVLVTGGLLVGLIPGVPTVRLEPELVLFGFIPPLVYAASFQAASFDLRAHAVHIVTLSTGLVLLTMVAVAAVAHVVAGLPWIAALVVGALAAPTDPVSASSIMRDVGAPERIVAILEGESLVNDGTGLAAFQVAVAAAAGGFSVGHGLVKFAAISAGGLAIGLACGVALVAVRRRVDEPSREIVLSLLAAVGSYTAASAAGCSGVLAAVATGLYAGRRVEDISSAHARLNTEPFWDALTFLLESMLFLLIGLQLPTIVGGLPGGGLGSGILDGALLVVAALTVRGGWMAALRVLRPLTRRLGTARSESLSGAELVVLGWSGMRGALSLAGALSIPLLAAGHAFPARDRIIFLVYIVVIGTLILPSLTLEPLIRRLGLAGADEVRRQELHARVRIIHAGLARLDELADELDAPEDTVERLRGLFELRLARLSARERRGERRDGDGHDRALDADTVASLRRELIAAERRALAQIRAERRVPAQALARIQRDIDLDETRLHG